MTAAPPPNPALCVRDRDGVRGRLDGPLSDAATDVCITLDDGTRVQVPRAALIRQPDGSHLLPHRLGEVLSLPVIAESLRVDTRLRETGRVRVEKRVVERAEVVDLPLLRQTVHVERVEVGRVVDAPPDVPQEGDVLIVPVVEELLVVEKRLVLREELHIRRDTAEFHAPQRFVVRSEEISVDRIETAPQHPHGEKP